MMSQQERWNRKYSERSQGLLQPNPFVALHLPMLQRGRVLDVACGDGRNAIYLAKHGFEVVGVDFSDEALRRLQSFAATNHVNVQTHQQNLDVVGSLTELGEFDNVIVVCFKPPSDIFRHISKILSSDGIFLITSFNTEQHVRKGFSSEYCLWPGEYVNALQDVKLVEYVSYQTERGYYDGYVFRKQ